MSPLVCFEPFASMQMRMQCRKFGLLHLHTLLLHGIVLVIEPNGGSNMLFDHGVLLAHSRSSCSAVAGHDQATRRYSSAVLDWDRLGPHHPGVPTLAVQ